MNLKKLGIVLLVLAMVIFAVGCAKKAPPAPAPEPVAVPEPAPAPEPAPVEPPKEVVKEEVKPVAPASGSVKYSDTGFDPAEVKVAVGATVTWENTAKVPLLISEKTKTIVSKRTVPGEKVETTFTKAGTFEYINAVKANHKGKVVVE